MCYQPITSLQESIIQSYSDLDGVYTLAAAHTVHCTLRPFQGDAPLVPPRPLDHPHPACDSDCAVGINRGPPLLINLI